jgi:putative membrane protein
MIRLVLRWVINAVALWVAITYIPGIHAQGGWISLLGLAVIFGFVNALFRPLLKFLTCPLIVLTLGLFILLINTLLFWLSGLIGQYFGIGFTVDGFWPAFFGSLVVSLVSMVLTVLVKDELEDRHSNWQRQRR